ncbi:uncharacterized protein FIBRA_06309 [Fibroporia radiculosa]|uniref:Cytochrome P450 n=1 Tax=Fibroporia radiculosa TaxID=599839 RepID=J4HYW9_9APHY|nr:uncharacterized protein FIBRA_06309 [Fibroporia radiculosa]CCM04147.1 predicted protein [Fibroporia radiculosa]
MILTVHTLLSPYFLLLSIGASALLFTIYKLLPVLLSPFTSTLRNLPGPPNTSWFYGNLKEIQAAEQSTLHNAWVEKYGKTIRYKGWLNTDRLYTLDTRAVGHILSHSYDYPKPEMSRFTLSQVLGAGLLIVEGEQHRRQRRIMNPAFGPVQVRELTGIFVEKANELCDFWNEEIAKHGEPARINVLDGLSKATLDVIGLAGFNYTFNSLNPHGESNELNDAFSTMFQSLTQLNANLMRVLKVYVPILRVFPDATTRTTENAQSVMRRIGMQLIADKKAEIIKAANAGEKGGSLQSRDLLTLLIKANMSTDIPENQRLSDEDVLAQVPTFLVAGHETTSNATTWCLYALAHAPEIQQKLREELLGVATQNPTMDELNELPYLDAVVRETMRYHAPVSGTIRHSAKDNVIPLATPFVDVNGQVQDVIRIHKGCVILIPILAINKSKELWGEDADEFKPERWITGVPEAVQHIPGVWGNMLSFLGGPRSCIGYRFSLVEMKALLFALVRGFEYEPAMPAEAITKKMAIVQRPFVRSEMEKGSQLPLMVRPYQRT